MKVYRVGRGATAAYRMEATLAGRTRDRQDFTVEDVARIDEVLLGLVREHGLSPVPKPARWEPCLPTAAGMAPRDVLLRRLRPTAYRGWDVPAGLRATVWACHTPLAAEEPAEAADSSVNAASESSARIRSTGLVSPDSLDHLTTTTDSESITSHEHPPASLPALVYEPSPEPSALSAVTTYALPGVEAPVPRRQPSDVFSTSSPLASLLDEIAALPSLTEVILPDERDPADLLRALQTRFCGRVGFTALAMQTASGHLDTFTSVNRFVAEHPLQDHHDVVVLHVDPSFLAYFHEAFSTDDFERGPLMTTGFAARVKGDSSHVLWQGMAGALADTMRAFREAVERDGTRVIVISQDARPVRGRSAWTRAQAWTDARVRSTLGDAGRRYAHQRYFIDCNSRGRITEITTWKDEHEGLTGRILYSGPAALQARLSRSRPRWSPRPRGRRNSTETPSMGDIMQELL